MKFKVSSRKDSKGGHDMVVGARRAGLRVSETVILLEFYYKTNSKVYREWSEKE